MELRVRLQQPPNTGSIERTAALSAWYDGDGRRIKTTDGSATLIFHYRQGSWDPVYVKDSASGLVTDLIFAGNLRIGKIESGVSYFYHLDHLGSVRLVTNNLVASPFITKYKPFGTVYATSGSERFTYTGKQLDAVTGLYYYGYRYYDSQVGRFTAMDNHLPEYMVPQELNRYSYALNNPNYYTDPDGRAASEQTRADLVAARKQAQLEGLDPAAGRPTSRSTDTGPAERFLERKLARFDGRDSRTTISSTETTSSITTANPWPHDRLTGDLWLILRGFGEIWAGYTIESEGCPDYPTTQESVATCEAATHYGGDLTQQGWNDFWTGFNDFLRDVAPPVYKV